MTGTNPIAAILDELPEGFQSCAIPCRDALKDLGCSCIVHLEEQQLLLNVGREERERKELRDAGARVNPEVAAASARSRSSPRAIIFSMRSANASMDA